MPRRGVGKGGVFSRCHGRSGFRTKGRRTGRKGCEVVVGLLGGGGADAIIGGLNLRVYIGVALEVEVVCT